MGDWSMYGVWGSVTLGWRGSGPSGKWDITGVGNANQRLFVVPTERLVVTVFAGQYNAFAPHSERILDRVLAARR
jgi:hypothetical protein